MHSCNARLKHERSVGRAGQNAEWKGQSPGSDGGCRPTRFASTCIEEFQEKPPEGPELESIQSRTHILISICFPFISEHAANKCATLSCTDATKRRQSERSKNKSLCIYRR